MFTAIVGINWGDEGKGRMVDLLSRDHQIVVRYQGDNSSEHTIIANKHRYVLNLLPAGILRPDVVCVMGNGMAIDPAHLDREMQALYNEGVSITPANLKISNRAAVVLPLQATDMADTPSGVSAVYGEKAMNLAIRMGDLLHPSYIAERIHALLTSNLMAHVAVPSMSEEELVGWAVRYGRIFRDFICDTGAYLRQAQAIGMNVLFEAPQGALRDVDFGMYPYTCSSSTVAAYAPIGAGIPGAKLDKTIGIMKAFSSMVGDGPFVSELHGEDAMHLLETAKETEVKDGRIHRVGAFDAVASRYGVFVQGADELALTKLDTLSFLPKIPVCVAYEIDGVRTEEYPIGAALHTAKPVIEYVDGWNMRISECRTADDLPVEALTYVKYIEHLVGTKITYISVGAEREAYIHL